MWASVLQGHVLLPQLVACSLSAHLQHLGGRWKESGVECQCGVARMNGNTRVGELDFPKAAQASLSRAVAVRDCHRLVPPSTTDNVRMVFCTVVNMQFESAILPPILNVIKVQDVRGGCHVLDVASHLDGNTVRTIAMYRMVGLARGQKVQIPVGKITPRLVMTAEVLEISIKGIDLWAPYACGGHIGLIDDAGVRDAVLTQEVIKNGTTAHGGFSVFFWGWWRTREGNNLPGVINREGDSKLASVFIWMNDPPGSCSCIALTGLTITEYFRDKDEEGRDVLLFIDNIFRFTYPGSEVYTFLCRIPSAVETITETKNSSITLVQSVYVLADILTDPSAATTFARFDSTTTLSYSIVQLGIYPAVDPLGSISRILDPHIWILQGYKYLRDIIASYVERARKFDYVFTGYDEGKLVPSKDTVRPFKEILSDTRDVLPNIVFYMVVAIGIDKDEKAEQLSKEMHGNWKFN
ncbi:P-loop containing nucleoside triphosphate hydrolase protein [Pisolithus croceorrhizus]|nr:P-loop containing nucleoside triphosphate hydrolase protein [Pisolithus croceorrhizus]